MLMIKLERGVNSELRQLISLGIIREEFNTLFYNTVQRKVPAYVDCKIIPYNFIDVTNCVFMNLVLKAINGDSLYNVVDRMYRNSLEDIIEISDFEVLDLLGLKPEASGTIHLKSIRQELEFYIRYIYRTDMTAYNVAILKFIESIRGDLHRFKGKLIRSSLIHNDNPVVFVSGDMNETFSVQR